MCSAKSGRTPLSGEARDRLVESTVRVCETSFFALVERVPIEVLPVVATEASWHHASVTYAGPLHGLVGLSVPEGLARDLFAAFLGFADTGAANDAEVEDVLGEFVSMVCGRWLTTLGGTSPFMLASPAVQPGGLPDPDDDAIVLSVQGRPVVVRAEIERVGA